MSDTSSTGSVSPKIISRATFLFEFSAEAQHFVNHIGQTYNEHPDSLMRLDFEASLGYLDLMVQNDLL